MNPLKFSVRLLGKAEYSANVKCAAACPVGTEAGRYASAILEGRLDEGFAIASAPNPLVSVCGYICGRPCEKSCRRGTLDSPVSIRALKRFLVDRVQKNGSAPNPRRVRSNERKVAVIGSGPAGLSAAYDLATLGYGVTIFERQAFAGGTLGRGVPLYRLPRTILDCDVRRLREVGVEIRLNSELGKDFTLESLKNNGYDAVFIATGLPVGRLLPVEGADLDGVLTGIEFLEGVNTGNAPSLGNKVLVIGGGNVAFDAARSALRVGGGSFRREVHLVCLESWEEMPADPEEVREGQLEGIAVHPSLGPKKILGKDGKVIGIEMLRVATVFDQDGRFNPKFVPDSESVMTADTIICTVGQAADLSFISKADSIEITARGTINSDPKTLATSMEGIFAGGDVASGPRLLIDAVADGRRAATSIDAFLRGGTISKRVGRATVLREHSMPRGFDRLSRHEVPTLDAQSRSGHDQVELGYDEARARAEASRCLKCFVNTVFDSNKCIGCGGCVDVCPQKCLRLVRLGALRPGQGVTRALESRYKAPLTRIMDSSFNGAAILKDEDLCIRCGLCSRRCPTGALAMESFELVEVSGE